MRISEPPESMTADALRVREILLRFDPIGITEDEPGWSEDEYDDLIVPILTALRNGMSADDLATELQGVIDGDYGLTPSRESCLMTARELVAVHPRVAGEG